MEAGEMTRIHIRTKSKKHLQNAKAYRKNEAMNRAFAKSLKEGGDFFWG